MLTWLSCTDLLLYCKPYMIYFTVSKPTLTALITRHGLPIRYYGDEREAVIWAALREEDSDMYQQASAVSCSPLSSCCPSCQPISTDLFATCNRCCCWNPQARDSLGSKLHGLGTPQAHLLLMYPHVTLVPRQPPPRSWKSCKWFQTAPRGLLSLHCYVIKPAIGIRGSWVWSWFLGWNGKDGQDTVLKFYRSLPIFDWECKGAHDCYLMTGVICEN